LLRISCGTCVWADAIVPHDAAAPIARATRSDPAHGEWQSFVKTILIELSPAVKLSGLKRTCDHQAGGPNSVLTRSRSVGARAKSLIMLRHSPSAILTGL
jgi:hypothetical protein